jgi:hypothetical protein
MKFPIPENMREAMSGFRKYSCIFYAVYLRAMRR